MSTPVGFPLSNEQADELSGTLPGVFPDRLTKLITPARFITVLAAIALTWTLAAGYVRISNQITGTMALVAGDLAQSVGLAKEGPEDEWGFADTAGDRWERRVNDAYHKPPLLIVIPSLLIVGFASAFGYGAGTVDRRLRKPGYRVRFTVDRSYDTTIRTGTGIAVTSNGNGGTTVVPTVNTVIVSDPNFQVISIRATRGDGASWVVQSARLSSFDEKQIDSTLASYEREAARLDQQERVRLARVYGSPTA